MQALRGDRHAPGEIVARAGVIVAALVAAPVHQHFARLHAAAELRAVLAIAGREAILGTQRRADADVHGLVAQRRGVGAELAGALQRHGLGIEHAHEQHLLVQRKQLRVVLGQRRRGDAGAQLAFGIKKLQMLDLETCTGGHGGISRYWTRLGRRARVRSSARLRVRCGAYK